MKDLTRSWSSQSVARDISLVSIATMSTAALAQVQVPWQPVPFTLQTLGVALSGLALGARKGAASQAAYLAVGAAGLPVFAGGKAGPAVLLGPTGGYLVAFIACAGFLGWVSEKGWSKQAWKLGLAMGVALLGVLAVGASWLGLSTGNWNVALLSGFLPFLAPELMKALAVALALPSVTRAFR